MITLRKERGKYWISSIELYDKLGRDKEKYRRWIHRYITGNGSLVPVDDYYTYREAKRGRGKSNRTELYLSMPTAVYLCGREGTIISRNIRLSIQEDIKQHVVKSYIKR